MTTPMRIAGLWRYPVKSLAGEFISEALITTRGIAGDRIVHVRGPEGVRTSRRQYRMLGLKGTLRNDGVPLINGTPWHAGEALAAVRDAAGDDAVLVADDSLDRFDVLPLLVATDGAVASFGRDVRRLRPNILLEGVEGLAERTWEGRLLHIGDEDDGVVIRLDSLRSRCPMTTVDPDTIERDPEVLRDIGRRFRGKLALNAEVLREGHMRVGDRVRLGTQSERSAFYRVRTTNILETA